jgi:hypothetical protein
MEQDSSLEFRPTGGIVGLVNESVVWTQPPEGDRAEEEYDEKEGELDESFAVRRLRRWLAGMFGVRPDDPDERPDG